MNEQALLNLQEILIKKYPIGIARKDIGNATGGILHPRTIANLDSLKVGIDKRYKIGRNTVYPVKSVIEFIRSKISY